MEEKNNATQNNYILEFEHVTKVFPGVRALDDINFGIKKGTVHVLVGENGAGKSTLLKVINGLYKADEGRVLFEGKPLNTHGPADALKAGISMIYQELNVIPEMTVLENMYLGREIMKNAVAVDMKAMREKAQEYLDEQGLSFNLSEKMKNLSVAEAQMLEIVKAISANARIILMDEPTSSLTSDEVEFLIKKIYELRDQGITVIYISHKMEEIFRVADYITVIRDGQHVKTMPAAETNIEQVIEMMVGRKMTEVYPKKTAKIGDVVFKVENFNSEGVFRDVSFDLHEGEILGVSGLIGAGRTEIARAVMAMDHKDSGDVYFKGEKLKIKTVNDAIDDGIVLVPEDRKNQGLNLVASIGENIALVSYDHVFKSRWIKKGKVKELVDKMVNYLEIKAPSSATITGTLSGGNQQKVVLGKWLSVAPKILILDEPTRGIDVGTKYEIYKLMHEMCNNGTAIILIDSDLEELMGMSDRVMVVREGEIAGFLQKNEINATAIMQLAAVGGKHNG